MKKKHLIKNNVVAICFSSIIIFFIMYFIINDFGLYQLLKLNHKKTNFTEKIINSKKEKKNITEKIKKLTEDSLYIEKIAREKYSMVKKGEISIPITKK